MLCIGAGGLGSPVLLYLAAAGLGKVRIIDDDRVDLTNLQRQVIYTTEDIGAPKAEAAARRLKALYPAMEVDARVTRFTAASAMSLMSGCDLVIDGCDNFATRYVSNDAAVLHGIPNVYGGIFRYEGQTTVFAPALGGPCYRCLYPAQPEPGAVPSCAEGGVLGVLPGLIGVIQATEAIKLLTGIGSPLIGRMLHVDTRTMAFRELRLRRDPQCPVCGDAPTIKAPFDPVFACQISPAVREITAEALTAAIARQDNSLFILDVRERWEHLLTPWPEASLAIPFSQLDTRFDEIPRHAKEFIVVCSVGERSAEAAEKLAAMGFSGVQHLRHGLRDFLP